MEGTRNEATFSIHHRRMVWYSRGGHRPCVEFCRAAYEAGLAPICPKLYLPLILNDSVPEEHKDGIDMGRDMLKRSRMLLVCGGTVDEDVKNDIAVAARYGIAATTLEGIMNVKGQGSPDSAGY